MAVAGPTRQVSDMNNMNIFRQLRDMTPSSSAHPRERSSPRRKKGGRQRILLPLGCLVLLAVPFGLSWASLRWIQAGHLDHSAPGLVWERDLGNLSASRERPEISPRPMVIGTFHLPEILSVEDAVETEEGWVLLDSRLAKIHFLDPTSGQLLSVGGEGPGPGELQDPVALAVGDSHLWVLNQRGQTLDRFGPRGEFRERRRIHGGGCLVGLPKALLASPDGELLLLRVCPATLPGPGTAFLEELARDGTLSPLLSLPLGRPGSRRLHLLRTPTASLGPGGLFLGTWDSPCVLELTGGSEPGGHRCLPEYERPETEVEERGALQRRFHRLGELGLLPLDIPEHYPWYDRIFSTAEGLVIRRMRGEEERDLVLLTHGAAPLVTPTWFPEDTFVGQETILSAETLLEGTRIRVYENPLGA